MKTLLEATLKRAFTSLLVLALVGCGSSASFSVMGEQNSFSQAPTVVYGKIDVLWVVDNSGSMASSQQDLMNNMTSFTNEFWSKGIDFRMAVITTDAYRSLFGAGAAISEFRKNSGFAVIDPTTPNGDQKLVQNINQGTSGNGDERAFQSFKVALSANINAQYQFPRQDSFLAVVIMSDEDDYSHDTSSSMGGTPGDMSVYSDPALHPVSMYTDYLDQITSSTPTNRRYTVHSIGVFDSQCQAQRNQINGGQRIGIRYQQISQATGGETVSICGNFATDLQRIAIKSIQTATRFQLNREPNPATIQVWVNGTSIPQDTTNGWTYDDENPDFFLIFHGSAIPAAGASITVRFDPVSIK